MIISKEQAALDQLCDAIELFNKEHFVSAVTLSAAAEEVLAKLLIVYLKENNLPVFSASKIDEGIYKFFKENLYEGNYFDHLNKVRNELKHHGQNNNLVELDFDFRQIALNHIANSVQNYKLKYSYLPRIELVEKFCLDLGIS